MEDILDFAIAEEEKAASFYRAMARASSNESVARIFESFAREEDGHKEKLQNVQFSGPLDPELAQSLNSAEPSAVDPRPDMEYDEIIKLVIQKEADAHRLYKALAEVSKDPDQRQLLLALAEEEARHRQTFEQELAQA
jgi:rubrerythrin